MGKLRPSAAQPRERDALLRDLKADPERKEALTDIIVNKSQEDDHEGQLPEYLL